MSNCGRRSTCMQPSGPAISLPGVKTRFENVNLVLIRENTEGLYTGIENEVVPGVVTSLKVATTQACQRIAHYAFRYATPPAATEDHGLSQGQHHEADRRHVPGRCPPGP